MDSHYGQFMSLAAASPVPRRPGSSRAAACRSCCTKCGPRAPTAVHKTGAIRRIGLFQFVSLRRRRGQRHRPAACRDAPARLAGACAPPTLNKLPAGSALAVDRDGFAAAITAALEAEPLIAIDRSEIAAPPPDWDSVIVATGPLTSPALAADDPRAHRRRRAVVLRRHRADRASRLDRLRYRLVSVALRQGRPRRLRRRLHQLPADARAIRRFRRRAATPATKSRSTNSRRQRRISTAACRSK